tara:strand:+ start:2574 stop:3071 length:498 start_codon:yes stop_codon:yes gene_type:complete
MINALRLAIIILPIVGIVFFVYLLQEDQDASISYLDKPVPESALITLDDKKVTQSDLTGTYLLNVWASYCVPCKVEHPFLMDLASQEIRIIGLNYKDKKMDARHWLEDNGSPYEFSIYDFDGFYALDLGVTGVPETFLIKDGQIKVHVVGVIDSKKWEKDFVPHI